MNKMPIDNNAEDSLNGNTINEAHQDLDETKRTITNLLQYRLSLLGSSDAEKINEFKGKAIEAINHLFDEETEEKKN